MSQRTLFSPEHEAFRDGFRRFIDREIAPFHADWEEQGFVDRAVWHKAGANGFLCLMWEYPITHAYADARVQRIYGGTNEIMKEMITRAMGRGGK